MGASREGRRKRIRVSDDLRPRIDIRPAGDAAVLEAAGAWTIANARALDAMAAALPGRAPDGRLRLDLSRIDGLDTVGALVVRRIQQALGARAEVAGADARHAALLQAVSVADECDRVPRMRRRPVTALVERTGRGAVQAVEAARDLVNFLGLVCTVAGRAALSPRRIRLAALATHLERAGIDALPILGLLSFLIGLVIAFQGAEQLRRFGAEIFVVDLLGVSILRELGILLTAILVAGRSGSAFTAQIGAMVANQEVDAMRTMGLDPVEVLVLPRIAALVIALPLLAFYADAMALLGGAAMAWLVLDIGFGTFLRQLQASTDVAHLFVGLVKAPVFAGAIGLVGCFHGLRVSGGADSVGLLTTRAVVEGIFLVIVIDAVFAVTFQLVGI
jgi:phospholipid/cholesterol/gamma-HCH transport system permease protein